MMNLVMVKENAVRGIEKEVVSFTRYCLKATVNNTIIEIKDACTHVGVLEVNGIALGKMNKSNKELFVNTYNEAISNYGRKDNYYVSTIYADAEKLDEAIEEMISFTQEDADNAIANFDIEMINKINLAELLISRKTRKVKMKTFNSFVIDDIKGCFTSTAIHNNKRVFVADEKRVIKVKVAESRTLRMFPRGENFIVLSLEQPDGFGKKKQMSILNNGAIQRGFLFQDRYYLPLNHSSSQGRTGKLCFTCEPNIEAVRAKLCYNTDFVKLNKDDKTVIAKVEARVGHGSSNSISVGSDFTTVCIPNPDSIMTTNVVRRNSKSVEVIEPWKGTVDLRMQVGDGQGSIELIPMIKVSHRAGLISDHDMVKMIQLVEKCKKYNEHALILVNKYAEKDKDSNLGSKKLKAEIIELKSEIVDKFGDKLLYVVDEFDSINRNEYNYDLLALAKKINYKYNKAKNIFGLTREELDSVDITNLDVELNNKINLANSIYSILCKMPSAIQIRYAGDKGLLVLYPHSEYDFTEDIVVTKSIRKFEAGKGEKPELELLHHTKPLSEKANLNYQFIQALDLDANEMIDYIKGIVGELDSDLATDIYKARKFMGLISSIGSENDVQDSAVSKLAYLVQRFDFVLRDPWVQAKMRELARKFISEMAFGVIPVDGSYVFIAHDPTCIFDCYKEGAKVVEPRHSRVQIDKNYINGEVGESVLFRSPLQHCSEVQKIRTDVVEEYKYLRNLLVLNPFQPITTAMGGASL